MRGSTLKDIEITVDWVPPANMRQNALGSFRGGRYATKTELRDSGEAHARAWMHLHNHYTAIGEPVHVLVFVRNPRELDLDNLSSGYKPFIDGIVKAGLLLDDKPSILRRYTIEWEGKGEPRSRVVIRDYV